MGAKQGLEVRDLGVRVAHRILIDRVSFEAEPGEIVAIIGPNGAGKSTLLEATLGLRERVSGSVEYAGNAVRGFADAARTFAYLPDIGELPYETRVRTLVGAALRARARSSETVTLLRDAFEIDALFDAPVAVLSRGERQRIALYCVLALDRPVVMLDEPFSVFDPLQLERVLAAVRHIAANGSAVVAAVHQLSDAEKIADRVLLLAEGRRVAWGTGDEIRAGRTLEAAFIALLSKNPDAA